MDFITDLVQQRNVSEVPNACHVPEMTDVVVIEATMSMTDWGGRARSGKSAGRGGGGCSLLWV